MHRFIHILIGTVFSAPVMLSSSAFAAEAGTYRPGTAYQSVPAGSPDICESQCSGDAQCRSWNYIKISKAAAGVCEFNSNSASPVPSSVSVSGENRRNRSLASVVKGSTNTVRVGSPTVTQPKAAVSRPSAARRVVRQPIPQSVQPKPTNFTAQRPQNLSAQHLSLTEQQRRQNPNAAYQQRPQSQPPQTRTAPPARFQHSLEDNQSLPRHPQTRHPQTAARSRAPAAAPPQAAYSHADPRLVQRLQQNAPAYGATPAASQSHLQRPAQTPVQQARAIANSASGPQSGHSLGGGLSAPPNVPPLQSSAQAQASSASPYAAAPNRSQPASELGLAGRPIPPQPVQKRVTIPAELSPRTMGAPAQNSLFGSLYDDVKVPRPVDPAVAADLGAPIPTVTSVPSAPIYSAPLPPAR